eukprot:4210747-Alexandrium_andersonii.AAC.1
MAPCAARWRRESDSYRNDRARAAPDARRPTPSTAWKCCRALEGSFQCSPAFSCAPWARRKTPGSA